MFTERLESLSLLVFCFYIFYFFKKFIVFNEQIKFYSVFVVFFLEEFINGFNLATVFMFFTTFLFSYLF